MSLSGYELHERKGTGKAELRMLRTDRESTPEQYTKNVNNLVNELICDLRKEREKNRRLIAAIRKLISK